MSFPLPLPKSLQFQHGSQAKGFVKRLHNKTEIMRKQSYQNKGTNLRQVCLKCETTKKMQSFDNQLKQFNTEQMIRLVGKYIFRNY